MVLSKERTLARCRQNHLRPLIKQKNRAVKKALKLYTVEVSTKNFNDCELGVKALLEKKQQDANKCNPKAMRVAANRRVKKRIGF